jgi:hypothetical protein
MLENMDAFEQKMGTLSVHIGLNVMMTFHETIIV